jgi:hypothetical protein
LKDSLSTSVYCLLRLAQSGDGARALADFDFQKRETHKMSIPLELDALKRRERRAPVKLNPCHLMTRSSIMTGALGLELQGRALANQLAGMLRQEFKPSFAQAGFVIEKHGP